jgi:hypothetical protein
LLLWGLARQVPCCGWPPARCSPAVALPCPAPDHLARAPRRKIRARRANANYETPHTCPGALLQLTSRSTIPQPQRQQQELQGTSTPKFPSDWVAGWRQAAASHLACFFFWSNGHGLIACGPASCCHPLPLVSAQRCERLTAFWLHPTLRRPEEECHHLPSSTHKPAI